MESTEESHSTEHGLKEKCQAPSSAEALRMPEHNLAIYEMCLKYFLASFGKIIFWMINKYNQS